MNPIRPEWPEVPEGFFDPPNADGTGGGLDAASDQFWRGLGGANPPPAGLRQGQQHAGTHPTWGVLPDTSPRGGMSSQPWNQANPPFNPYSGGRSGPGSAYGFSSNPIPPHSRGQFLQSHQRPPASAAVASYGGDHQTLRSEPYPPGTIFEQHVTSRIVLPNPVNTTPRQGYGYGAMAPPPAPPPVPGPPPLSDGSASYLAEYLANMPYKNIRNPSGRGQNERPVSAITRNLNQHRQSSLAWGQRPPKDYSEIDVQRHLKPLFNELEVAYGNPNGFDNDMSIAQLRLERMRFNLYPQDRETRILGTQDREYREPTESSSNSGETRSSGASGSSSGRIGPNNPFGNRPTPYPLPTRANDRYAADPDVSDPFASMGLRNPPFGPQRLQPPSQKHASIALDQTSSSAASGSGSKHAASIKPPTARYKAASTASRPRKSEGNEPSQFDPRKLQGYGEFQINAHASAVSGSPADPDIRRPNIPPERIGEVEDEISKILDNKAAMAHKQGIKFLDASWRNLNNTTNAQPIEWADLMNLFKARQKNRPYSNIDAREGNTRWDRNKMEAEKMPSPPAGSTSGEDHGAILTETGKAWVREMSSKGYLRASIALKLSRTGVKTTRAGKLVSTTPKK